MNSSFKIHSFFLKQQPWLRDLAHRREIWKKVGNHLWSLGNAICIICCDVKMPCSARYREQTFLGWQCHLECSKLNRGYVSAFQAQIQGTTCVSIKRKLSCQVCTYRNIFKFDRRLARFARHVTRDMIRVYHFTCTYAYSLMGSLITVDLNVQAPVYHCTSSGTYPRSPLALGHCGPTHSLTVPCQHLSHWLARTQHTFNKLECSWCIPVYTSICQ